MLIGESFISRVSVISLSTFCTRVVIIHQISLTINRLQQFSLQWFDDSGRPALIREFLQYDVVVKINYGKSQRVTYILAFVEWYARHPQCNRYSKPVEVWANYFESLVPEHAPYVPVGRFQSNCVSVKYQVPLLNYQYEKVNVIIPLLNSVRV